MNIINEITDYEIIGTFEKSNKKPKIAGRGVMVDEDGKIALMHVKAKAAYTFPGGGIEKSESIVEGMKRELREETGCSCEVISEIGCIKENRAQHDVTMESYFYLVKTVGVKAEMRLTEHEKDNGNEVVWFDWEECKRVIFGQKPINYQFQYIKARDVAVVKFLEKSNKESAKNISKIHYKKDI